MPLKNILFVLITLFILSSCAVSKYPTRKKDYWGVVMTCITDSTALTIAPIVKIKAGIPCPKEFIQSYTNPSCSNRPDFISFVQFWPSELMFNFKDEKYYFVHSPKPSNPKIKFGEDKFAVAYSLDAGSLSYNKKTRELTLTSEISSWKRIFIVSALSKDSILTLTAKNDGQ